jgi:hypothetical protein
MDEFDNLPEDDTCFDAVVLKLIRLSRQLSKYVKVENREVWDLLAAIEDAASDVESWLETDDPSSNGWVGADGLP